MPADTNADHWDRLVQQTEGIDPWCSSRAWVESAWRAWAHEVPVVELVGEHGRFMGQGIDTSDDRHLLVGMERLWGFGSPLVGVDAALAGRELDGLFRDTPGWDALVLPGISLDSGIGRSLIGRLARDHSIRLGPTMTRQQARLDGDVEAWFSRRSAKLRRNLTRAERAGEVVGVEFEVLDALPPRRVLERVVAIEEHSWKGTEGSGILPDDLSAFYLLLLEACAASDSMRASVARIGDEDAGYILGGVIAGRYRGFQISYTEAAEPHSIGNLLQLHELRRLAAEGVTIYDMGMDMDYKRRWADQEMTTHTVMVVRH